MVTALLKPLPQCPKTTQLLVIAVGLNCLVSILLHATCGGTYWKFWAGIRRYV